MSLCAHEPMSLSMTESNILERALNAANADEADASFISVDHNITRFANSQIHQNMSEESACAAGRAREAARHSNPLQGFKGLYRDNAPVPQLDTFDERTAAISPLEKARALPTMFDGGSRAEVHLAGAYATGAASVWCGNTHGARRFTRMTHADATVIAIGANTSGYATARERRTSAVDIGMLGDEATLKATLASHNTEDLEPGAYDVILEPPALAEVFDWMNMIAFSGQSFEDGSSFFVGNLGKQLLGENFTLVDDAIGYQPFPFDIEGRPKRPVAMIERGVIRTPVLDTAWADRLGLEPTAHAWQLGSSEHGVAFHVTMAGGDATREQMI